MIGSLFVRVQKWLGGRLAKVIDLQQMSMMIDMNQYEDKRIKFRQQIRRKQIERIFSTKRKYQNGTEEPQPTSIHTLLQQLKINRLEPIPLLINLISQDDTFETYQQQHGDAGLLSLCTDIIHCLVDRIMPTLISRKDSEKRLVCLRLLSNIFADRVTPHSSLLEILTPGLFSIYASIKEWGICSETIELGWVTANTLCQRSLFDQQIREKNLQILLGWAQQLLQIQQHELLIFLYRSLSQFFSNVDRRLKKEGESQVQDFKIYRMIILSKTIELNISARIGDSLSYILKFVNQNISYFQFCDERLVPILLQRVIQLFGCLNSTVILQVIKIVKYLIKEHRQEVLVKLIHNHFNKIIQNLQMQTFSIKIEIIQLIKLVCKTKEVIEYLQKQKELEQTIKCLVINIKDPSVLMELTHLTWQIMVASDGEYGKEACGAFQQIQNDVEGETGIVIRELLQFRRSMDE